MPARTPALFKNSRFVDTLLFFALLCLAACLRFWNLEMMPDGFHGDEAVSGIEGEHILRDGYIGPYTVLALGQPTGPLYLTAVSLHFFGSTMWAVRAVSALVGTLTVGVLYLMVRRHYEAPDAQKRAVAFLSALALATFHWHLHFSRIGFPIITWPLCTLLATWAALEAVKHRQARWWCVTGLALALGIYSYNAHILCIAALVLWLLFYLARQRDVALPRRIGWLLVFGVAGFVVAIPMLLYVIDPSHNYFEHARVISVFSASSSPWGQLGGFSPKAGFLIGRYFGFWEQLSVYSLVDGGDASGVVPVMPFLMLLVALVGLVRVWKFKRQALVEISLFLCLLLPLGPATTLDGFTRRAFAMAPFMALLFGMGIVELYLWANQKIRAREHDGKNVRLKLSPKAALVGTVLLWGAVTLQSLNDYFVKAMLAEPVKWTFGQEMTETVRYLNKLPSDAHVYFYSDRWSSQYESRVFLAPRVTMEDRSREFGTFSFVPNPGIVKPYFILLGGYRDQLPTLKTLYPESRVEIGPLTPNGQPCFIAVQPNANVNSPR